MYYGTVEEVLWDKQQVGARGADKGVLYGEDCRCGTFR